MAGQGNREVCLFDLALLLWAQVVKRAVDLVHGRVLRVVFRVEQPLDAAILRELLPVVHLLKDVVHCDGHFAARLADHARMVVLRPPVVHDGLELGVIVLLQVEQPLLRILVLTVHIVHLLVAQNDDKDGNDEDEGAHKSLRLQLLDREEGHHAHLVRDHNEERNVCGSLDELALAVNLFAVDVEQVQTVDGVSNHAEKGCGDGDERDCRAEKDADGEDGQCLGVEVPIVEIVLFLPQPGLEVLIYFAAHVGQPRRKVAESEIGQQKHVVS